MKTESNLVLALAVLLASGLLYLAYRPPVARKMDPTSTPLSFLPGASGSTVSESIPNTPEVVEILQTIEWSYEIEADAAITFDLSKLPTVFINDPRFDVSPSTLEVVRQLTNNPFLKSAGWLDYKMAMYSWRRDSILHSESVHATAKAENRDLTDAERASLMDPWGRTAPARVDPSFRHDPQLEFISLEVNKDIARVVLDDGPTTAELTLVLVDKKWYIAGRRGISVHS
jgi:hypothetical protein